MLTLIFAAVSVILSAPNSADAQQNGERLERRVKRLSNRMADRLEQEAHMLNRKELRSILSSLQDIRATLNGNSTSPGGRYSVRGKMERQSFDFVVTDLADLYTQCTAFVKSKASGSVDEIEVSVNFGASQRLYNSSSYWKTSFAKCMQIINVAKAQGIQMDRGQVLVIGKIERQSFEFTARDVIGINQQCEQFYNQKNLGSVDEIEVSANFAPAKRLYNSSSYWRSAFEVCQQIIQAIR